MCKPAPQRLGLDEVRERLRPVDLDDRDQLAKPLLELGVLRDVDLRELERLLGADRLEDTARRLAQVAPGRGIEDYAGYG